MLTVKGSEPVSSPAYALSNIAGNAYSEYASNGELMVRRVKSLGRTPLPALTNKRDKQDRGGTKMICHRTLKSELVMDSHTGLLGAKTITTGTPCIGEECSAWRDGRCGLVKEKEESK